MKWAANGWTRLQSVEVAEIIDAEDALLVRHNQLVAVDLHPDNTI